MPITQSPCATLPPAHTHLRTGNSRIFAEIKS